MKTLKTGILFALLSIGILLANCNAINPDPESEPEPDVAVTFTGLVSDGSGATATTKLTLTFDKDIDGLSAADITLNNGTTGASKGALTRTGTGTYTLGVSGITTQGNVTVTAVTKSGYAITGAPKHAAVYPAPSASPADGATVTSFAGFTVPSTSKATYNASYQGKNGVYKVEPNTTHGWAILTYSLAEYAGKEITITITSDVRLEGTALTGDQKVNWQVNNNGKAYPTIASSSSTPAAGTWLTVNGTNTITVDAGGGTLYLSSGDNGLPTTGVTAYITNLTVTITVAGGGPVVTPIANNSTLTIGQKGQLTSTGATSWSSSNTSIATVSNTGIVTAVGFSSGGTSTVSSAATGTVTITATGGTPQTFTINTTMASQVDMMTLPPLKDQFADYFMIGNIYNPNDATAATGVNNTRLTRHYGILTPENNMKPSYLSSGQGTLNTTNVNTAVRMIDAARASGMKVVGHTLLWHSQNPNWINNLNASTGKETALGYMRTYIQLIAGHANIKGKIYSWDVLNEVFPDGVSASADWTTSMRKTGDSQAPNPWFMAIGSDFVYEGFKAARQADPNAILYYNDYNLDSAGKATMVRNMVRDVNDKWKTDSKYDNRLLIEGIGMQSHHNTNVSVNNIRNSINMFRALGVRISISEIDVLCYPYSGATPSYSPNRDAPLNSGKLTAANLYGQYMKLFVDNADIIDRVTFWGVNDEQSWRKEGLPLIFDGSGTSKAKPAYYKVIEALE